MLEGNRQNPYVFSNLLQETFTRIFMEEKSWLSNFLGRKLRWEIGKNSWRFYNPPSCLNIILKSHHKNSRAEFFNLLEKYVKLTLTSILESVRYCNVCWIHVGKWLWKVQFFSLTKLVITWDRIYWGVFIWALYLILARCIYSMVNKYIFMQNSDIAFYVQKQLFIDGLHSRCS